MLKNKKIIIAVVTLLLLVLVGAGLYVFMNSALSQTVKVKNTQLIVGA